MSNSEEEPTDLGIDDEQLPEDLQPGDDNPLAEGLEPGETVDDLLDGGKTDDEDPEFAPDAVSDSDQSDDPDTDDSGAS